MSSIPVLDSWCANGGHPRDPICDESLSLNERLALDTHAHPTGFTRRDRVAIIAALQIADVLSGVAAQLQEQMRAIQEVMEQ